MQIEVNLINVIIMVVLVIGVVSLFTFWSVPEVTCPGPQIIYKYVPEHTLDMQFSDKNKPSKLYKDMFINKNIWVGGYDMGDVKAYDKKEIERAKLELVPEKYVKI
jgi:hypothetical protein